MLASQPQTGFAPGLRNPSFPIAQPSAAYHHSSNNLSSVPTGGGIPIQSSFRAPAHKHAHHLHSIPPREKSTRTLIIDHMLWVHGRTRFAQARAELGMTDRTGGPSSPYYAHRRRPENYEEEDEEGSEGEEYFKLKARTGDPNNPPGDDEEARLHSQDLSLARSLRLRAEGVEKVVTSMLEQPPAIHSINDEDIWTPPTSPKMNPSKHHDPLNPNILPNGVRLRLALGTIINDLFARQAPPPPHRHQFHKSSTPSGQSPASSFLNTSTTSLPPALASLSTICAAQSQPAMGSSYTTSRPSSANNFSGYSPQPVMAPLDSTVPESHFFIFNQNRNHMQHPPFPSPSSRTRSLYMAGADPSTANSPPSFRCPRHLHIGCEICVEAKTGVRPGAGAGRGRSNSFGGDRRGNQNDGWKGMPGGMGPGGGGITGWQDGSGIGSGLLRPGVHGSCLRRKIVDQDVSEDGDSSVTSSTGAGNTKLSELIPRFIRLSALVAAELGIEARDETDDSSSMRSQEAGTDHYSVDGGNWGENMQGRGEQGGSFSPLPDPMSPNTARAAAQSQERVYEYALRPTREWYMLLAGLLTRAVLEGYLTAGWRGSQAVECLLTVGLGMADHAENDMGPGTGFEHLDPDGLPGLLDSMKLLFPASKNIAPLRKGQAEEEYEMEMYARLSRFYDIPASTPDLSTHMEDLAWQYPAEPVERAAVRFCEAIARWRGKPELETYKKKPRQPSAYGDIHGTPGSSSLTIESIVHSNPTTPTTNHTAPSAFQNQIRRRPSIDMYFTQAMYRDNSWNPNKRMRSPDDGRSGAAKRPHGQ